MKRQGGRERQGKRRRMDGRRLFFFFPNKSDCIILNEITLGKIKDLKTLSSHQKTTIKTELLVTSIKIKIVLRIVVVKSLSHV